jgi:hypothetical protein
MAPPSKDPGAQVMFILWSAMLMSHAMLFGVGQIVPHPGTPPETLEVMAMALTGAGVVTALASALAVPILFRDQPYQTMMILRFALAETPTIFGLILDFMGADMQWVYILTGLGVVAHFAAFPTQRERENHGKK